MKAYLPIPPHWSAETALTVVVFLEDVVKAIWRAHGAKMAKLIQNAYPEDIGIAADDLPLNPYEGEKTSPSPYGDDEIPF